MRRRSLALPLPLLLLAALPACAPAPQPDWEDAQSLAEEFTTAASGADGFLGSGTVQVASTASDDAVIRLSYPSDARVDRLTVACFGEGTARFGYSVRSRSGYVGTASDELPCDGAEHVLQPDVPHTEVDEITLTGRMLSGTGAVLAMAVSGVDG